jgi:amino-acid N-acetyltransferase
MKPSVQIRAARESDLLSIKALLESSSLPTAGIENHLATFFVAELDTSVIGAMGIEQYNGTSLLRSAVVAPEHRGLGVGAALYETVLSRARTLGVPRLLLFTTTAESYFRARGFRRVDVSTIAGPVTSSVEFRGACPATATCMVLDL